MGLQKVIKFAKEGKKMFSYLKRAYNAHALFMVACFGNMYKFECSEI